MKVLYSKDYIHLFILFYLKIMKALPIIDVCLWLSSRFEIRKTETFGKRDVFTQFVYHQNITIISVTDGIWNIE